MKRNEIRPPRFAEKFLTWYCRPDLLEDLQGDLNEYFARNIKQRGAFKAKLIYIIDVLKFLRIYTIRRPEFINLLIHWLMLASYIKTSGRNLVRNKLFSSINIIGLAISMSVGMLIIGMLHDISTYDRFHENSSRIYRVISNREYLGNKNSNYMATTSLKSGRLISENFSQPEAVAILKSRFSGDLTFNNKTIPLTGYWANPEFLKVFSFPLLKGNPQTALKDPYSLVLTEESAEKIFGDIDPIGKTIMIHEKPYQVTGVIKDMKSQSTIKFEMLSSLTTYDLQQKERLDEYTWDNIWSTYVFLLLPKDVDLENVQTSLDALSKTEDKTVANTHIELKLQALTDIQGGDSMNNEMGAVVTNTTTTIFIALGIVVLISACFNYTNLSIAKSLRRTREVGIRKVIGAGRANLMLQFIVEAIIISLFALAVGFVFFGFLKPNFTGIEKSFQEVMKLDLTPKMILYFVALAVGTGIVAGFLPALFFSKVNVAKILKDMGASQGNRRLTLRKVLIVFQYTLSVIFICATIAMFKQYEYFINFNLGFTTENILNIELNGNKTDLLKKDLNELPEVKSISQSTLNPSIGNYWATTVKYHKNPLDSPSINYNIVDEHYIPQHEFKLVAGRNFEHKAVDSIDTELIVNEKFLKRFNIGTPEDALGEVIEVDGKDVTIIGVMKDFQYGKSMDPAEGDGTMFRYSNSNANLLNVQLQSDNILETYAKIETIWKKHDDVHPFTAKFYHEQIEDAFQGLKASIQVAGFLAFLAITIASMGLLGMVVFTTQARIKEISIRKVLGATDGTLLMILGRGFIIMLAIAVAIGFPITVLFFEQVAFPNFGNHAPLSILEMVMGVGVILGIALLMIFAQAFKVTRVNPADTLKAE